MTETDQLRSAISVALAYLQASGGWNLEQAIKILKEAKGIPREATGLEERGA